MTSIKRLKTEELAHTLAMLTGESLTTGNKAPTELQTAILKIGHRCAALPDRDTRYPDEILGYDQCGLPS